MPLDDAANGDYRIGWSQDGRIEVLTFDILDQPFAVEASLVYEIVDPLQETQVPGSSPLIGSIANFRGRVIPLADLRRAFGLATKPQSDDSRIVVIELSVQDEPCLVGLKVDKVHEVTTFLRDDAEVPPHIGLRFDHGLIRCLIKRSGAVLAIPDFDHIFALPPFERSALSIH